MLGTGGLIALGWLLVPQLIDQIPDLVDNLATTLGELEQSLGLSKLAAEVVDEVSVTDILLSPGGARRHAAGADRP